MNRDIKSVSDWFGEFNQIHESIAKTRSIVEGFAKWVGDNSEVSDALVKLD